MRMHEGAPTMTLLAEPILASEVADRYEVIDPAAVRAFLAARPHLAALLAEAPNRIAAFFPRAPLQLECQVDPDDSSEILLIRVMTNLPAAAANRQLDALDEQWYLDLSLTVRRDALLTLGAL
jgi:hypothetical protein